MRQLLIATSNEGKLREIFGLLDGLVENVISLSHVRGIILPHETGQSFEENALIKARHAATEAGIPALADDSGLEVDILGNRPGVYSARYAGDGATDEKNNEKLLDELKGVSFELRTARFVSSIACCYPDGTCLTFAGVLSGVILDHPRGEQGFGYDPLFLVPEYGKTLAELPLEVKNHISHRARAFAAFKEYLVATNSS